MTVLAKKCLACLWAVCLVIASGNYATAATLSFNPSTATVGVGDQIGIGIDVSGLEDVDLGSFDLNLNYEDTFLSFDSYVLGDGLGVIPGDAEDWSLGDEWGDPITDPTLQTGSVNVVSVPDALWLLSFGLAGLVGLGNRRSC